MFSASQDDRYFARMENSLGDKKRILPHLKGKRILDIGCGEGSFPSVLREEGYDVAALDGSEAAVKRARERGLEVANCYAHQALDFFQRGTFDTITCSSILHEVYSYGDDVDGFALNPLAVQRVFRVFRDLLRPYGRVVIRDGLIPKAWNESRALRFTNQEGVMALQRYLEMIPFRGRRKHEVDLVQDEEDELLWYGNAESCMEFLYTYTWGVETYPRETQELYGIKDEYDWKEFLALENFRPIYFTEYLQPGYEKQLKPRVRLMSLQGEPLPFPSSNMILVAEKLY